MNLVLDFGNSLVKTGVMHGNRILWKSSAENIDTEEISNILSQFPGIKNAIVSSVSGKCGHVSDFLRGNTDYFISLDHGTLLPFENKYTTPSTLGRDRLAAVAGALHLFPCRNCLVVDAGTAITFDFINENRQYLGGNISPGMKIRFRALHEFTKRLPLAEKNDTAPFLGDSTEHAIVAGVQNGIIFEIDGYVTAIQNKYRDVKVILSGGDAIFFENKLKSNIFAAPDLIFSGLNFILDYNMEHSNR